MNKIDTKLIIITLVCLYVSSCKKFVQIDPAPDLISTKSVFESDQTALSALSGVYTQLRTNLVVFSNGSLSVYGGLAADELFATTPNSNTDPFYLNELLPTTAGVYSNFYAHAYRTIYQTNAVIEGVQGSKSLSQASKKQFIGEMKIVRAMMYFYLVNLFGDVPLVTTTDYQANAILPRTDTKLVYDSIISDLTDARTKLSESYPSAGKARPNKFTASAFLARVYLYNKEWMKAEELSSEVINSGAYNLVPSSNISSVFLKNAPETIWELASPNETNVVGEANAFVPSTSTVKPTYALSSQILADFEPADKRMQMWTVKNTVNGQDYYYPAKYKQRSISTGGTATEYEIVLRLAEQYLVRAEARAQQNNNIGALQDLNIIHNRASLPSIVGTTQAEILDSIRKENQIEFFTEWGHRWLDLKRWGLSDSVLSSVKGANWQPTDKLWPIPEAEIIYNPFLNQNPGY